MAAEKDTPPASADDVIVEEHHDEPPKGTKRQRTRAEAWKNATNVATSESLPNKRRRKEPASAAEDAAIKEAESHKEKAKEAKKVRDAAEKKRREEEKVVKQREKEAKKARAAAEKKRKAEEKAAIKAAKDKEREETKKKDNEEKKKKQEEKAQKEHRKKQWEDYCTAHVFEGATLAEEPEESITQTDAGQYYTLKPNELACLPHHPRVNTLYKNTTKLFNEEEVRPLAFRKYAMLAGVSESPESEMLDQGKQLWEHQGEQLGKERLARVTAWPEGLARDIDQGVDGSGHGDVNWWRDPRELRKIGFENGKLPIGSKGASRKPKSDDEESDDDAHHED